MFKIGCNTRPYKAGPIAFILLICLASRADEITNNIGILYNDRVSIKLPPDDNSFFGVYGRNMEISQISVYNRLSTRIGYRLYLEDTHRRYDSYESHVHQGQGALMGMMIDPLRDTFGNFFPIDAWEYTGVRILDNTWNGITRLFSGTVGNPAEEHLNFTGKSYFASYYEDYWLVNLERKDVWDFGIRPWTGDPYLYLSGKVGHQLIDNDIPIMLFDARLRYVSMSGKSMFGSFRVEEYISFFPVGSRSLALKIGGSFNPVLYVQRDDGFFAGSIRLEKNWSYKNFTWNMFLQFFANTNNRGLFAAINLDF